MAIRPAQLLGATWLWLALAGSAMAAPAPPDQPASGPGGSAYSYGRVVEREIGRGATGAWIFLPDSPSPHAIPVIIFAHGWAALTPDPYAAWIDHLVRRGNIVIYPRYQQSLLTPPSRFLGNALGGVGASLDALAAGRFGVRPDLARVAAIGHSAGGIVAAGIAAQAAGRHLPAIKALMVVEPGSGDGRVPLADLSTIPRGTLLLGVVGADDQRAGAADARRIFAGATAVAPRDRSLLEMSSDAHGMPALLANHFAPTAERGADQSGRILKLLGEQSRGQGAVNALDWYGFWRLGDALAAAAFDGADRRPALGPGAAQTQMGQWSDGIPVAPLRRLD